MELKHIREEKLTASIGFSIYSNSESIVLSYASIFEVLYNQSILFEQIKEDEKIKNEFINIAAHELRTPIMPILNGMEILEERLGEKQRKKYKREIDIITRNASRLQNLAESILQVSRIESGKFSLNIQKDVDIHFLISQVLEDIEKKYMYTDKAKKVAIVFEPYCKADINNRKDKIQDKENHPAGRNKSRSKTSITDKIDMDTEYEINKEDDNNDDGKKTVILTPQLPPLYIDCDSQKVSQVVFNLLDNAVKFTEQGTIFVSTILQICIPTPNNNLNSDINNDEDNAIKNKSNIDGGFNEIKNCIIVTIEDTGSGVNPTIKDQLFEKFSSRSIQGTGLGLYLSKEIVEAHGGRIWYQDPNVDNSTKVGQLYKRDSKENIKINNNNDKKSQKLGSVFKFSLPLSYQ
jgi:signal transduction histidine kinase